MTSKSHPLTDPEGDTLQFTRSIAHPGKFYAWTSSDLIVGPTVGPFAPQELRAALDAVAPQGPLEAAADRVVRLVSAGSYTRTDEPVCCGPLDEDAKFWHARWHEAATQRDARDAMAALWKETARALHRSRENALKAFSEMYSDRLATLRRAKKAEQERDEARAELNLHALREKLTPAAEPRPLDWREHPRYDQATARDFLDAAWEAAYVPEGEQLPDRAIYIARHASGNYRIERAYLPTPTSDEDTERRLLDPPVPTRPEGAAEIEAALAGFVDNGEGDLRTKVADFLASRGVRVEGDR